MHVRAGIFYALKASKTEPTCGAGLGKAAEVVSESTGGATGDRTPDLCIANAALSQLSYCPKRRAAEDTPRETDVKPAHAAALASP